MIREKAF
jgi:hypothetical protein